MAELCEPYVVASTSGVRARNGGGASYAEVGWLGLGSVAHITQKSQDGKWGYVAAAKLDGECWGETDGVWIHLDPCCKGLPTKWVSVTGSSDLNLRKKADVTSPILGKLPNGTDLTVTTIEKKGGYTWGFVAYAYSEARNEYWMREGYVALEYCKKAK